MDFITLQGTPCIKKCYVNKREIEIKNRPVFSLFSKLNSLWFIELLRYFCPSLYSDFFLINNC
jgi:hypothetical protein